MKSFESVDEILDFAIKNEEEAFAFYTNLSDSAETPHIRIIFEELAGEEKNHREKLVEAKKGKILDLTREKVMDLKISDYMVDIEPNSEMNYQNTLILAMKKEKKAFKLYMDLADETIDGTVKDLFLFLAQEESKHKLRLEIEYDEYVLTDD